MLCLAPEPLVAFASRYRITHRKSVVAQLTRIMHPAYILCGGRSRRFGSDKALAQPHGRPQLLSLASQLSQAGHQVHYVADSADRYLDLGVTCLVDPQPDCGPLAGLGRALAHHVEARGQHALAQNDDAQSRIQHEHTPGAGQGADHAADGWLLLVNCDQAHWDDTWYEALLGRASSPRASAVTYFDTLWQPLPGLYHVRLLEEVNQRLHDRRLSLHNLLDALVAREQCERIVSARCPSAWSFNTPDELADLPPA